MIPAAVSRMITMVQALRDQVCAGYLSPPSSALIRFGITMVGMYEQMTAEEIEHNACIQVSITPATYFQVAFSAQEIFQPVDDHGSRTMAGRSRTFK